MPTAKSRGAKSRSRTRTATPAIATRLGIDTRLGARTEFRIYPSIGVARIGDSRDSFMIGPEAPGLVSGVLQINVLVPAGAGTGPQPVSVSLGNASSQAGVTVSLQ